MPGFVSEPNFEEDISIEVEPEEDAAQNDRIDPENEDDSEELQDLK
jgi:hypothetical protein